MKIYACQFDIVWENKLANFKKVRSFLEGAKPQAAALVVLPEMFATGFSMNVLGIGEDGMDGPTAHFLSQCAEDFGINLIGGFVGRGEDGKGRNQLAVFGPDGKRVADYTKIHPFSFGEENRHFTGGDRICHFEWQGANVSPFVCYDLRFAEIFRLAVRGGAEIFTISANWPAEREMHWLTLLRARAIENQAYVVGVNRCGRDPNADYSGRSTIIDPRGTILADAGADESVISAEIDLNILRKYRAEFPILQDMRPEFLGRSPD